MSTVIQGIPFIPSTKRGFCIINGLEYLFDLQLIYIVFFNCCLVTMSYTIYIMIRGNPIILVFKFSSQSSGIICGNTLNINGFESIGIDFCCSYSSPDSIDGVIAVYRKNVAIVTNDIVIKIVERKFFFLFKKSSN